MSGGADTLSARGTSRRSGLIAAGAAILSLILLASLFGRIMDYDLRRDEFMFVPPAVLLGEYELYRDIFFNHVPYSAWLFRGMHLLLPSFGLLAVARLTVFLAWLLLLGCTGWIGWRLTGSRLVAFFGPAGLMATDVFLGQTGMVATNNLLPLPFVVLGLGLFAIALAEGRLTIWPLFVAGVSLSIACGLKISAIAFVPAVAIGCFLVPRELTFAERLRFLVLPVGLGGIVGALPIFWLALTQTGLFFAHIAGYHTGPHVAYWQANAAMEPGLALHAAQKFQLALSVWFFGAAMLLLFVTIFSGVMSRRGESASGWPGQAAVVIASATISAAAFGFVPTPGFPQYYAAPLVGLPILIALFYRRCASENRRHLGLAMSVALVLMVFSGGTRLALGLNALRDPAGFTTTNVVRGAQALRTAIAEAGLPAQGAVATLAPIYPLEAGLRIYPEFSAGPFGYRVVPYAAPEELTQFAITGPDGVETLFYDDPPVALLTGFDAVLDQALVDYAQANGYVARAFPQITDRYGEAVLWLAPTNDAAATTDGGDG